MSNYFDWTDYFVFGSMLDISAFIGIYYAYRGQKTANDILVGNK
jgi:hypothetical protein